MGKKFPDVSKTTIGFTERAKDAVDKFFLDGSVSCRRGVKVMAELGSNVLFVYVCLTEVKRQSGHALFTSVCVWRLRELWARLWGVGSQTMEQSACAKCTRCLSRLDCLGPLLCLVNTAVWCENGDCSSTMGACRHKFLR